MDGPTPAPRPGRLAVIDTDSGFLQVLAKRLERLGWQHRVLAGPGARSTRSSRCGSARVVVDPAVLGPQAWDYLEQLCAALPGLGVVVCTGPSTVAQRVRGLRLGADDWVTKPCHPRSSSRASRPSCAAAAAPSRAPDAGPSWPASSRSAPTSSRPSSAAARSTSRAASSS